MHKWIILALGLMSITAFGQGAPQSSQQSSQQPPQQAYPAELALPFGSTNGKVVISGDYLIFVNDQNVENSFVMPRDNVQNVSTNAENTTVALKQPMRDQAGQRDRVVFRFANPGAADAITSWSKAGPAGQPGGNASGTGLSGNQLFNYSVKHDHKIGSCNGRLMATTDRLIFESLTDVNDSRQWAMKDIKEVQHKSPYKLEVKPFTGNDYSFEFLGKGMDNADFAELTKLIAAARVSH